MTLDESKWANIKELHKEAQIKPVAVKIEGLTVMFFERLEKEI